MQPHSEVVRTTSWTGNLGRRWTTSTNGQLDLRVTGVDVVGLMGIRRCIEGDDKRTPRVPSARPSGFDWLLTVWGSVLIAAKFNGADEGVNGTVGSPAMATDSITYGHLHLYILSPTNILVTRGRDSYEWSIKALGPLKIICEATCTIKELEEIHVINLSRETSLS